MSDKIGFIQGRLSPIVNGRIQAFPEQHWRDELNIASKLHFPCMEWTLDKENLYQNPLMSSKGREEIRKLLHKYGLKIPSLTGDCLMRAPFYKEKEAQTKAQLIRDLENIIKACGDLGINFVVFPLVDEGRLETTYQEQELCTILLTMVALLKSFRVKIVFESDYTPQRLKAFIKQFDPRYFGINYDSGNSASLGYDPDEEFEFYGERIDNVHVKDRLLGGGTVPLGTGNADFQKVFKNLRKINYSGNYILQTARASDGDHSGVLCQYRDQVLQWI